MIMYIKTYYMRKKRIYRNISLIDESIISIIDILECDMEVML